MEERERERENSGQDLKPQSLTRDDKSDEDDQQQTGEMERSRKERNR